MLTICSLRSTLASDIVQTTLQEKKMLPMRFKIRKKYVNRTEHTHKYNIANAYCNGK